MTTDNKTLADVQPGGRVRLGDAHVAVLRDMRSRFTESGSPARTAALDAAIDALSIQSRISSGYEEERFETWALSEGWDRNAMQRSQGEYKYETIRDMWRAWQAALPAQPSPGGQGDAPECAKRAMYEEVWNALNAAGFGDDLASSIAALAARQPVGEPFGYCADFDPGAHEFSHTFYYLAPGEKVPGGCTPFFAAPPAQAVDLGQFRASVKGALIRMQKDSDTECAAHKRDLQRLLALIDSQAVGE